MVSFQEFARHYLDRSGRYEAGTTDELLKGRSGLLLVLAYQYQHTLAVQILIVLLQSLSWTAMAFNGNRISIIIWPSRVSVRL